MVRLLSVRLPIKQKVKASILIFNSKKYKKWIRINAVKKIIKKGDYDFTVRKYKYFGVHRKALQNKITIYC